jgi:hypothetical protein
VVHHALCNIIEPVFERSFISDSYANRVGKGTHRALDRCQEFARRYKYVLQCDVKQFFPSVDLTILEKTLARKVDDSDVMWLVQSISQSGIGVLSEAYAMSWFEGDDLFAADRPRGLPIGNLTSQFWANCYMNSFDHFVKRELGCQAYLRFVDDMALFANDKDTLRRWHTAIVNRLAALRLTIHPAAQPRPVTEGISFLGFVLWPQRRRVKRRKVVHFRQTLSQKINLYAQGMISLKDVTVTVQGWLNHVGYANTVGIVRQTLSRMAIPRVGVVKQSSTHGAPETGYSRSARLATTQLPSAVLGSTD